MEQFSVTAATEAAASTSRAPGGAGPAEPVANPRRRTSRLGLRARATVAFGCVALVLSATLATMAYELTRSYLIKQRQSTAIRQAYVNARLARSVLRTPDPDVPTILASLQTSSGSVAVLNYQDRWFAGKVGIGPNAVPASLRKAVLAGNVGRQRFTLDGEPQVAVGVPLPAVDAFYFEFSPMTELERSLSLLARALALGAAITALGGAAVGRYASSRVLRPLRGVATAASRISHGALDTRLDAKGDPDLTPLIASFNEMVDALQDRIVREARFASDVSHELRTPLAAIGSAVNIVRRRRHSPEEAAAASGLGSGAGGGGEPRRRSGGGAGMPPGPYSTSGSSTTKRAPPPTRSSTHTWPWWRRACSATSDSPRPVPSPAPGWDDDSPRAKRSKMWCRSCSGTPGPRSSTAKRTTVSLPDTISAVGPPA